MRAAAVLIVALWAAIAHAHKPSDSYLTLQSAGSSWHGQWDIALRDLDNVLGLDANADGVITWGELRTEHDAIAAYALSRLDVHADGTPCTTRPTAQLVDHHTDGAYTVLRFIVDCPRVASSLDLRYRLFFDVDPQHRGLLHLDTTTGTHTVLFSVDSAVQHLDLTTARGWHTLADFWRDGVWHIWIGFDHILFLLALLLPVVMRRTRAGWVAVGDFREALTETLKVVTAFTLAHSITLSCAALGIIALPARLVESGIAASVVVAALNNVFPLFDERRWLVAFGFGLLHGFGFAGALADSGLPRGSLVLSLIGFNAGVESGQLVIVAAFLPLAYALRRIGRYQRLTVFVGSSAIIMLALVWLAERALDLRLLQH